MVQAVKLKKSFTTLSASLKVWECLLKLFSWNGIKLHLSNCCPWLFLLFFKKILYAPSLPFAPLRYKSISRCSTNPPKRIYSLIIKWTLKILQNTIGFVFIISAILEIFAANSMYLHSIFDFIHFFNASMALVNQMQFI